MLKYSKICAVLWPLPVVPHERKEVLLIADAAIALIDQDEIEPTTKIDDRR
jgi:hypothetical protein